MVSSEFPLNQHPYWVAGHSHIEGDNIILDKESAEEYSIVHSERRPALLADLANLRGCEPRDVVGFVGRHGLLWHGPEELRGGTCLELLSDWRHEVYHLRLTIHFWLLLKLAQETGTAQPVRNFLRRLREPDIDHFYAPIPDNDEDCLETVSLLLAERITDGMKGCSWTLVAECTLAREGVPEVGATDFAFGEDPPSLVAAAYVQVATRIANKVAFCECEGCGTLFTPGHSSQKFCNPRCNARMRKARQRAKED